VFWKPQNPEAKKRINHWLLQANKYDFPTNNWRCEYPLARFVPSLIAVFRVLINLGLRLVGAEYSQQAMEDELNFMESFYASHVGLSLLLAS
jgi:hypothetical protein